MLYTFLRQLPESTLRPLWGYAQLNLSPNPSPCRRGEYTFPPSLVGKGVRGLGSSNKFKTLLDLCVTPSCKITLNVKKRQPPLLLTEREVIKKRCYNFTLFSSPYVKKKREKSPKSAQVAEITTFFTSILTETNVIFPTHFPAFLEVRTNER